MQQENTKSIENLPFTRRVVHRISSLVGWNSCIEDAHFTTAETLTLCAAILLAVSLLSLPIVFHFVEIEASNVERLLVTSFLEIKIIFRCECYNNYVNIVCDYVELV